MGKRQWEESGEGRASDSSPLVSLGSQNAFGLGQSPCRKKPRLTDVSSHGEDLTARSSVRVGAQGERASDDTQAGHWERAADGERVWIRGARSAGAGVSERARGWDGSGESGEDTDRNWQMNTKFRGVKILVKAEAASREEMKKGQVEAWLPSDMSNYRSPKTGKKEALYRIRCNDKSSEDVEFNDQSSVDVEYDEMTAGKKCAEEQAVSLARARRASKDR
ncbi:hypothetical protein T484DRAFT_1899362, partial [Baffinella frigidus]